MNQWTLARIKLLCHHRGDQINQADFREIGETLGAFWEDLRQPGQVPYHAIMVSGLHTNGFINVSTYMAETNLAEILAAKLIKTVNPRGMDVVVGPAPAAVTLAFEVARQKHCRHGIAEKDDGGKTTKIGGRMQIRPNEKVLVVNELMSTVNGSTYQTRQGVRKHQPKAILLSYSAVLVDRCGESMTADGADVRPVFRFAMKTWTPERCPHCKAGSTPLKPKITEENWLKLTGRIP